VKGLWGLALKQAAVPALIIWLLICGGLYLRSSNVDMWRAAIGGLMLFIVMTVVCRLDLERQRRAEAE
jgi:hypothetical protein